MVRDSFVGGETVPLLFKHDINSRLDTIEVITRKQPDYKRLREYVFHRVKLEFNDAQSWPILFHGGEMGITLHFRKKNYL